jgi:hypothetical protein
MPSQEHEHANTMEHGQEIARGAHERSQELGEQLKSNPERFNKKEAHEAAETARHEALTEALFSKEQGKERRSPQADRHNAAQHHIITHDDREASFNQTMDEVRKHMPRANRSFSEFIHHPTVERISETVGKTIARPNAILAGGLTAFVAVLGLYFYAKYAGFALRGSETIIAFAIGWLLGILFDFFKTMFTGKQQ